MRQLTPEDWQLLRSIRLRALADAPDAFGSTLGREELFEEADWRARLAAHHGPVLLATDGHTLAGIVRSFTDGSERTVVNLVGMWVAPEHRGSGVGSRLLDAFVDSTRSEGRIAVRLTVVESNEPARRLYGRHGFVETGETESHPKGGAVELVMVRYLDGT